MLCYTIAVGMAVCRAVFFAERSYSAYLSVVVYVAAHPVVYFAAAWVFYYGLTAEPRPS